MLRPLYWYWYFRYGAYEETLIDKYVAFLPHPFSFSGDEDEVIVFSHIDCEGHRGLFHRSRVASCCQRLLLGKRGLNIDLF